MILTSNPLILGSLIEDDRFFYQNSIFATGGKLDPLRLSLYSIVRQGDWDSIRGDDNQIDICILGFRGISANGDIYIDNEEEINQKKNLIEKSRRLFLILTPDKLNATGLFKIANLSREANKPKKQIYLIVASDEPLNDEYSEILGELSHIVGKSCVKLMP